MEIDFHMIISIITSFLSTVVLIPQLWYSFHHDTKGLSIYFLIIQETSAIFWVIYSIILKELPMIISMGFYATSSTALLILKIVNLIKK